MEFSAVNTIWVLVGAALVFFMQAGFAMVETGFTRAKNAGNIIMKNLMDFAIGTPLYWLTGFGIMFAGSMADLAAERLSLKDTEPLEAMGDMEINGNSVAYGIGKTGNLAEKLTVKALAEKVKQAFDLPFVLVYGEELMDMEVEKVALCPGAGGSVIEEAIHAGAKALVTGDISHHQGIDAAARNMAVIDAGHYGMEHIFIQYMAGYLKENLPVEMEIVTAPSAWPTVLL